MRITFHGAARTVTGSKHLIEVDGKRILLDCGMVQGKRNESREQNLTLPFDAKSIDVLILSHAHIDHSGNIPNLVKSGFRGDIISTYATRDLCASMLIDSASIQERDVQFVNKHHARRGETPVEPIYTQEDATKSLGYFITQNYDRPRQIMPGVTLTFKDAGHMLGSAFVILDIEDRERGRDVRLVFSGDIGRKGIPIIRDPDVAESADVLIMESTYGDRQHPPYEDDTKRMEQIIVETYKKRGMVLIPSFAVGRTQQLVYTLNQLARANDIPDMPVYVDSPLAIDVTSAYRLHPECYDDEIRGFIQSDGRGRVDPFGFDMLNYTRSAAESKKLNFLNEPAIIIAASGMMEAGRIRHHLRHGLPNPRNAVLVVGFCAPGTLGSEILDRPDHVHIFGDRVPLRAEVLRMESYSAHGDRAELARWLSCQDPAKVQQLFLVHGIERALNGMQEMVAAKGFHHIAIPRLGQRFMV